MPAARRRDFFVQKLRRPVCRPVRWSTASMNCSNRFFIAYRSGLSRPTASTRRSADGCFRSSSDSGRAGAARGRPALCPRIEKYEPWQGQTNLLTSPSPSDRRRRGAYTAVRRRRSCCWRFLHHPRRFLLRLSAASHRGGFPENSVRPGSPGVNWLMSPASIQPDCLRGLRRHQQIQGGRNRHGETQSARQAHRRWQDERRGVWNHRVRFQ